jgi:hypothetical protein
MPQDEKPFTDIDEKHLDQECLRQPSLYWTHSKKAAKSKLALDDAKSALDVVEAKVNQQIRADPAKYGLTKATEASIKSWVLMSKPYREAHREVNQAIYTYNIHQAAVTALEHKKRSLTLLVQLHGQNYFAEPTVTRENKEAYRENNKKALRKKGVISRSDISNELQSES